MLNGQSVDAYHGPFNSMPTGLKTKAVVTIHDIMQLQNPGNIATSAFVQATAGRFWRTRIAHAVRNADRICTVSHATRDAILERFPEVDEHKITVTYNGADPYFFEPAADEDLAEARRLLTEAGSTAPFVLCIGNESPHKNHHRGIRAFLKAFADRPECKFVLVRRSVRHDPRMAALLETPAAKRQVVILEHLDRKVLRALYRLAQVFFFPSWVEGFGLPILESMAAETPVLTGNRSAPGELASDAAVTASPFDIDEMATTLRALFDDDARRAALKPRGVEHAATFTWRQTAEGTLAAYRSLKG